MTYPRFLGSLISGIALMSMAACGQAEGDDADRLSGAQCASQNCVEVALTFLNPAFEAGLPGGGGILGDAQVIELPRNAGRFRVHVDESLAVLADPPIDSAVYNLRLVSVLPVIGDTSVEGAYEILKIDPRDATYHVDPGAAVQLHPIWQSVYDTPHDRGVPAGVVASQVEVTY